MNFLQFLQELLYYAQKCGNLLAHQWCYTAEHHELLWAASCILNTNRVTSFHSNKWNMNIVKVVYILPLDINFKWNHDIKTSWLDYKQKHWFIFLKTEKFSKAANSIWLIFLQDHATGLSVMAVLLMEDSHLISIFRTAGKKTHCVLHKLSFYFSHQHQWTSLQTHITIIHLTPKDQTTSLADQLLDENKPLI